ncbi:MAG: IS1182 family transposase [Candidatus Acidiferrales bacterium]
MSEEKTTSKQPLIRFVNRQQMSWRAVDVERLIGEDHAARAIWTLVGRMDLSRFYHGIESSAEEGGRPAIDPQLLISLWVYAYSVGMGSAREVARRCAYDPAFQWLTGLEEVNYHTLADFRVEKQQELDELFTQVLAALSKEGLITLEQVMQDGTKIKALASTRSFQREGTIQEHLERARQRVAEMGDPRNEEASPRAKQAQARARREPQERLESAREELQKLRERKTGEKARSEARVSTSDPQARVMKQSDRGLALSYNAQISTDAAHGLIVGATVTQEANDSAQLLPAVDRVEERLKKKPRQMVADGGYTTRDNIEKMAGREIDFLGSMRWENVPSGTSTPDRLPPSAFIYQPETDRYFCPEGKILHPQGRSEKRPGLIYHRYVARTEECQTCTRKPACCPENQKRGRSVVRGEESVVVLAFRQKMASEEAQAQYRRRGRVVEFCHAWIKSKLGLRQFHVRGLLKTQTELMWTCLTYNLQQWIRLRRLQAVPTSG